MPPTGPSLLRNVGCCSLQKAGWIRIHTGHNTVRTTAQPLGSRDTSANILRRHSEKLRVHKKKNRKLPLVILAFSNALHLMKG